MNPFTSKSHSEWFLLPREVPSLNNFLIRHQELEDKLVEYQVPPTVLIIGGYWPSLVDLRVTYPRTCSFPCPDQSKGLQFWQRSYNEMIREIYLYPLGIHIELYFNRIMTRYKHLTRFCQGMPRAKVARLLEDIFKSIRKSQNNANDLLIFPAYLHAVVPTIPQQYLTHVCRRIKVVVQMYGGHLRVTDALHFYSKIFGSSFFYGDYGFGTLKNMFEYCSEPVSFHEMGGMSIICM